MGARQMTAGRTCPRAAKRLTLESGSSHGAEWERSFRSWRVREQRASSGGLPGVLMPPARSSPPRPALGRGPAISWQKEKADETLRPSFPLPSGTDSGRSIGLRPGLPGTQSCELQKGWQAACGLERKEQLPGSLLTRSRNDPLLPTHLLEAKVPAPCALPLPRCEWDAEAPGGQAPGRRWTPVLSPGPRPAAPSAGTGFARPRFSPASQASAASELTGPARYCPQLRVGLPPGGFARPSVRPGHCPSSQHVLTASVPTDAGQTEVSETPKLMFLTLTLPLLENALALPPAVGPQGIERAVSGGSSTPTSSRVHPCSHEGRALWAPGRAA